MGCFEILVILLALQGQVGAGVQETVPAPQNLVPNGRMEGEYVAGVAPGWAANCYGDYEARFEKETANVHSGSAAQKIVCTRFASGGIQIRCSGISVEQGKPYTLQAWLRGEGIRSSVLICIRQHAAPYTKYLAQYVRVSDRWRRFTVIGPSTATDPDCGVYIWYGSTGTLWIDDVVLLPGIHKPEAPAIDAPPVKGNRVYNSSFELGTCGWVGAETADGGWHGSHCLRITAGRTAESQPFTVTAGQAHTISMYARGAGAKLSAEISEYADEGGDQPIARHHETAVFSLTQDWQRYSFPAVLEAPFTCGYMLRLTAQGADALVDAVQVEEGPLSAYAPSRPLELGLELPVLKRYPLPRQPVEPLLRVWSAEARSPLKVTLTWRDFFGERRPAGEATVRPGPDGTANVRVRCRGCDYGIYSLSATAGHDCAPGEVVVGVLPADDGLRRPQSFFGTHAQMNPRSDNIGVLVARRAGMRWYRLHDFNHHVQWIACEPEQHGEYKWADEEILDLHRRGFCLLGTLVRTPKWAGRDYPPEKPAIVQARVPRNLGWFGDFTDKVVRRYKDVIGHWEMWNEPYGWGFWAGTAEEYVELERLGFLAAKQADPACRVVGMCVYPGVRDWIEAAVAAGGLRWMDILSFHVYLTPSLVSIGDSGRSPLEDMVLYLCSLLREAGRADTPIWDTEGGVGCPSFYSWLPPDGWSVSSQDAASTVVKACAQLMGQGVEKWFYYFVGFSQGGSNSYYRMNNISYVEMDIDGSPKATLLAHAAAARLLDERPFVSRIVARGWTAYVFDDRGKGLAVVWARQENGSHPTELLDLGSVVGPVEVIDLMGRSKGSMSAIELDVTPVYLRSTASPTALAKALRGIAQRGDRSAR